MIPVRGLNGARVAVLGLGRSGLSAARALAAGGAVPVCWDDNPSAREVATGEGFECLDLKKQGASILLVEQNFSVARALGDTVAVMEDGRITWTGKMAELSADAALQERLMGLSMEAH